MNQNHDNSTCFKINAVNNVLLTTFASSWGASALQLMSPISSTTKVLRHGKLIGRRSEKISRWTPVWLCSIPVVEDCASAGQNLECGECVILIPGAISKAECSELVEAAKLSFACADGDHRTQPPSDSMRHIDHHQDAQLGARVGLFERWTNKYICRDPLPAVSRGDADMAMRKKCERWVTGKWL